MYKSILDEFFWKNIVLITFSILIIPVIIVIIGYHNSIIDIYQRNIARIPHITGEISLTIYGEHYVLDNTEAELIFKNGEYESGDNLELNDGKFKKIFGDHGENLFILRLTPEFCMKNINQTLKNGLNLEFGYIASNDWHKNHTSFDITIKHSKTKNGEDLLQFFQSVSGDDNGKMTKQYYLKYPLKEKSGFKLLDSFI